MRQSGGRIFHDLFVDLGRIPSQRHCPPPRYRYPAPFAEGLGYGLRSTIFLGWLQGHEKRRCSVAGRLPIPRKSTGAREENQRSRLKSLLAVRSRVADPSRKPFAGQRSAEKPSRRFVEQVWFARKCEILAATASRRRESTWLQSPELGGAGTAFQS